MLRRDPLEIGEEIASGRRQMQRVRTPVGGVAASFREPALLEIVDERDHGAAVDSQRVAERLLRPALGGGEVAQHPEVPGMEAESLEAIGEFPMGVGAELDQQERKPPTQGARGAGALDDSPGMAQIIPRPS